MAKNKYFKRDISWLYFNHRVLQEANDPNVPLYERIKFLAIFSSNLDEFFRVRVAILRNLRKLSKETKKEIELKPKKILKEIKEIVESQQNEFGRIYRGQILPQLQEAGIHLVHSTTEYQPHQISFINDYFEQHIKQHLDSYLIHSEEDVPFLADKGLYFAIAFNDTPALGIVSIPTKATARFITLPPHNGQHYITFVDDIIKFHLSEFTGHQVDQAYSIKVSRDAEMYLDEDYQVPEEFIERIKDAVSKRDEGAPTRFLFDNKMPQNMLNLLKRYFDLDGSDTIPGARYHNFNDFMGFPDPVNNPALHDASLPALKHLTLEKAGSLFEVINQKDQMLHFPYQAYDYVPKLIQEAADDPRTQTIKITLYRVASRSQVVLALLYALKKGKEVMAFIEAKARFDEASNIFWGEELEKANATVFYSFPNIKVHSKLLLITREINDQPYYQTYIGTGNFNEKTARIYGDHALLTANQQFGREIDQVFGFLSRKLEKPETTDLLVSPFTLRKRFTQKIDREIEHANAGHPAYMILKMNSLEDKKMIKKLYEASQAGVKIQLIVRGICVLVPGVEGLSENIEVISIIDRYLEHARVYIFGNNGTEEMYIASADWMKRNLDRRVEVSAPILDPEIYKELRQMIDIQLKDNVKARYIEASQSNAYRRNDKPPVRAQVEIYNLLAKKHQPKNQAD